MRCSTASPTPTRSKRLQGHRGVGGPAQILGGQARAAETGQHRMRIADLDVVERDPEGAVAAHQWLRLDPQPRRGQRQDEAHGPLAVGRGDHKEVGEVGVRDEIDDAAEPPGTGDVDAGPQRR